MGQIVCVVAADTYAHAKQATKKVKIVYEDVEPVIVTVQVTLASACSWGHLAVSFGRKRERVLLEGDSLIYGICHTLWQ